MSKREKGLDGQSAFDWEQAVDDHISRKEKIVEACYQQPATESCLSVGEACAELAVVVKRALRRSGMSREELVDGINAYFGSDADGGDPGRKPLSIHMLNHYLSKPCEYPLPAFLLIPIISVLGSLEPLQVLADTVGGRVISGAEVRLMNLGKLETTIAELQRLKRELKGAGR